jgi:hypothetical protein
MSGRGLGTRRKEGREKFKVNYNDVKSVEENFLK